MDEKILNASGKDELIQIDVETPSFIGEVMAGRGGKQAQIETLLKIVKARGKDFVLYRNPRRASPTALRNYERMARDAGVEIRIEDIPWDILKE